MAVDMHINLAINAHEIKVKAEDAFKKGLPLLSEEILNDCNEFCKEDSGILIASSYKHSDIKQGRLIWQTPYAKRQYWEIRTAHTDVNPKASWRWAEVAKKTYISRWQKQAQKVMEMNLHL